MIVQKAIKCKVGYEDNELALIEERVSCMRIDDEADNEPVQNVNRS